MVGQYVGQHYSQFAEELVAQYGQYVAEQLAEIALGEEAAYDEVELCESPNRLTEHMKFYSSVKKDM